MPVVCIGFYCIQPTIKFYTHGQQILATHAPVNTDWIIGRVKELGGGGGGNT